MQEYMMLQEVVEEILEEVVVCAVEHVEVLRICETLCIYRTGPVSNQKGDRDWVR